MSKARDVTISNANEIQEVNKTSTSSRILLSMAPLYNGPGG